MTPAIIRIQGGRVLADKAMLTDAVSERITGWIGKPSAEPGEGLLIAPCASIHTLGLKFTLDAVFLDSDNRVTRIVQHVKPGRFAWGAFKNLCFTWRSQVLELPDGAADGLKRGDILEVLERQP